MAKSILRFLKSDVELSDVADFFEGVLGDGTITGAGRHKFVLQGADGSKIVFKGDFTVENGVITGGQIKGLTGFLEGEKAFVGTGYDIDYTTFSDTLDEGEAILELLFTVDKAVGSKGDDVIFAIAKTIEGGDGNDTIVGNVRSKTIRGGDGNDLILAGVGNDKLFGEKGHDTFLFNGTNEGVDRIRDFEVRKDKIAFSPGGDFASLGDSVDASEFFVGAAATTADHHIIYDAAKGRLYFDADGTGATPQILMARLDKDLKLTAANFFLDDFFS